MAAEPTITIEERAPQPALVIERTLARDDIKDALGEIFPKVYTHATQTGAPMAGPPFTRYLDMAEGKMRIQAGVPLAEPGASHDDIEAVELSGGPCAVVVHTGPYDDLQHTYAALERWLDDNGRARRAPPWEVYLTDPGAEPDPAKWRTEVVQPID